ncbi:hypothetical protein BDP55DRAFT_554510 [Colletotrichum godetiae]|uniref:Bms1-type G domain-containing protein n=1 Tax=Colletotrichum godetiae TaxID=1209918 RepID=A0AAJ0AID0_9PEZI|nr:uncharacterized protein BDP55DRAFT_554510 [Colletotrichum godetiae]KAK1674441.1 hypothetical protein BDP55DRAFT_554510 [Colletotrichum godetiae]
MSHSHRPTTKVTHKPFKSKHASKGALRDAAKGRLPGDEKGTRKTPHQQVLSKFDRRNQAKQRQIAKRKERLEEASLFVGRDGAPRIVAVVPLCHDGDAAVAIKQLNESVEVDAEVGETPFRVSVDRFKQKVQYIPLKRDLNAVLDATRVADFVVVMLSADVEVDELGELMLRSLESQGLSTLFTVVYGVDKIDQAKHKQSTLGSLRSYITHFHPEQEKLYQLENRQECANLMRSLCNTTPKGVRWREDRSWMLAEDIKFASSGLDSTVITGVVRGRGLKANRLVQLGDFGVFQVEKITSAPLPKKLKRGEMAVEETETEETLDTPDEDQDDLAELAPDAPMEDDEMEADEPPEIKKGVLLDDHHYFNDDYYEAAEAKTRVPKGTSNYQAAWYLGDDVSDSGSDMEDFEMQDGNSSEDEARPEDGLEGAAPREPTEGAPTTYAQSEKFIEPDEEEDAAGLAAYRARKTDEVEDDKEFPDEIELHPGVLARERLQRYRGLKSLRTSEWLESEDRAYEPEEWRKLLQIPDYQASRSRSTREALVGGVAPGTRVHVYLKGVPASFEKSHQPGRPVTLFSLLRHEQKKTAVNYLFNLSADYNKSVKAKEELIVQCGPRRFTINPVFSQPGNTPNNVHKFARYLHPGQSAVATFMGPITWGAVPVLFFKRSVPVPEGERSEDDESSTIGLTLIGTGTALPSSTNRVIAKRAILTGHPYHIHKKIVTIRYMFFNREDVEWFKALPLWTKRGRTGFMKEPLGTHGYFKATFDACINPQDAVGVSLYKRVFPRNAVPIQGSLLELEAGVPELVQEGDVMME